MRSIETDHAQMGKEFVQIEYRSADHLDRRLIRAGIVVDHERSLVVHQPHFASETNVRRISRQTGVFAQHSIIEFSTRFSDSSEDQTAVAQQNEVERSFGQHIFDEKFSLFVVGEKFLFVLNEFVGSIA